MIVSERTRARLADTTRFGDVRQFAEIDSTNRYLVDLARAGAPEGVVAVADHQWLGRGRRGRSWQARPGGALLASILLRPRGLARDRRFLATAALALAGADACTSVAGVTPSVKWPNDLMVDDHKLAGILATADGDAIVAGIGLNVGWAPDGAACLDALAPAAVDRGELLAATLVGLEGWCDRWDELALAYRARCGTVGRRVALELPGRRLVGMARAVDERGQLRVAVDGGNEVIDVAAADVFHLAAEL